MPKKKSSPPHKITSFKPLYDYLDYKLEDMAKKDDIKHLPTKTEFYTKMDQVVGELKAIREEQATTSLILSNHEDRLVTLKTKSLPNPN